jgi:Abortive infection C-terminus
VLPLWRVVQGHLGWEPGKAVDPDVRQMLQGLASTIQGLAALRTHQGSAHGRGPDAPIVEARHARLAVHSAHTLVVFVMESNA